MRETPLPRLILFFIQTKLLSLNPIYDHQYWAILFSKNNFFFFKFLFNWTAVGTIFSFFGKINQLESLQWGIFYTHTHTLFTYIMVLTCGQASITIYCRNTYTHDEKHSIGNIDCLCSVYIFSLICSIVFLLYFAQFLKTIK